MIVKILNHSFIYAVFPKLPILAGFLILPFITPYLTNVDYGIYGIVFSIYTGATVLKTLGLDVILMNTYIHNFQNHRFKHIWNEIQGFLHFWVVLLGLIVVILILLLLPAEASDSIESILYLSVIPIIVFSPLQIVATKFYQMEEKPMQIGKRSLFAGIVSVILTYVIIVEFRLGYMGWVWSLFVSEAIMFVSYIYPIWIKEKLVPNFLFRRRAIKRFLKISLPLVPHTSAFFLLDFSDRIVMINKGVSTANIGLYDFAYRFAGYARVFSESIHQASSPLLIKELKVNRKTPFLRDVIFLESYLVILVSFIISLWMKEIFELMVNNDELKVSYDMGIILTMSYAYKPMYTAMATVFYYNEKTKEFWKISFIAGIINILLNIILIPIFGFKVAVITTFLSFLYIGYAGFLVTDFKKLYSFRFKPVYWITLTCILLVISYSLKDMNAEIKLIVSAGISLIFFFKGYPIFKKIK